MHLTENNVLHRYIFFSYGNNIINYFCPLENKSYKKNIDFVYYTCYSLS